MITTPNGEKIPADLQKLRDKVTKQLTLDEQKLTVIREAYTSQKFKVQDAIKEELGLIEKNNQRREQLHLTL